MLLLDLSLLSDFISPLWFLLSPSLQLTRLKKHKSRFLYLGNLKIKFENWNMKNEFSISNFLIKIGNWKLKISYHFSIFNFELKIKICKNVFFHFSFKLKIEWHFRFTDSWDEMESVYRRYNSFFDLKTKWILKIFHFPFFNFKTKIEKWNNFLKFIFWFQIKKWNRKFRFSFFEVGFKSK